MDEKITNILLRGVPGCGKTTLIKEIIGRLGNVNAQGFYTSEIREDGERKGFKITTLNGDESILSHVDFKGPHKVGKYTVNEENLEDVGADALIKAQRDADVIVIDEIGKMELFSELVKLSIVEALASSKIVLGTIMSKKDEFADKIKDREDTIIIEVTKENRDKLTDEIIKIITDLLS
ncbi:MAG: NTPase [Candidatus Margulisbacteria bacterium]|nr:NTPase [Candidatus Margulisiibacteriota bacterium]MBU1021156.1 NTPase [Candidatus Margulisiibacteriota bacterium]MBU1729762.1 NTPase [Candidatus Margulisiibacteriota bacterium]MBU1955263.1 NTPase [Candidatus Margulisiibacteriota bacterium]